MALLSSASHQLLQAISLRSVIQQQATRSINLKTFCPLFEQALQQLVVIIHDGTCRTLSYRQLKLLELKWQTDQVHKVPPKESKLQPERVEKVDFLTLSKVDNHIHHSSCMTQQHLLRFVQYKAKTEPDVVVTADGQTLRQVFADLKVDPLHLTTDILNMRASKDTFQRFDLFNLKYNVCGQPILREIFLKYDNHLQGRYLGEITQEVLSDLHKAKHVFVEWRISIYGRSSTEWQTLARWMTNHRLLNEGSTPRVVQWLIQIPRLYATHRATGHVQTFGEMLHNIFDPLLKESDQQSPELQALLQHVVGFDTVDDESVLEPPHPLDHSTRYPPCEEYISRENPPYAYFLSHLYFYVQQINRFRQQRGLNTFAFRPHSGETGTIEHMAVAFLLADGVNHGITLDHNPTLQYLFYLTQIPLSISPLCNNLLFKSLNQHPFPKFFMRGLNVALSTDNPALVHLSPLPLLEEYSVAQHVWKLESLDVCELARNSIVQSGFPASWKQRELDRMPSSVKERVAWRHQLLQAEWDSLQLSTKSLPSRL